MPAVETSCAEGMHKVIRRFSLLGRGFWWEMGRTKDN